MHAYVINLDCAPERWEFVQKSFLPTGLPLRRVAALNGAALVLPDPRFCEKRFRSRHGRLTNPAEIGCYLSHLKAMTAFLESGDEYGLIAEDDVLPEPDLAGLLEAALEFSGNWDVLRLSGLSRGIPLGAGNLWGGYRLCISLGRLKGSGAYLVNRKAAEGFVNRLCPMWLPFDHALDREWVHGLRGAYVLPFPCSQSGQGFKSSIQKSARGKVPGWERWLGTYPYQACNEVSRWVCRLANFLRALGRLKVEGILESIPAENRTRI